jgi:hypothetical protein
MSPPPPHHIYRCIPAAWDGQPASEAVLYCSGGEDIWGVGINSPSGVKASMYTSRAGVEAMRDACNAILAAHPEVGV